MTDNIEMNTDEIKIDKNIEEQVALTASTILVAIAAFSLPIMVFTENAKVSSSNEVFGIIGLLAIITSSLLIDWIFDERNYKFEDRFKMLNFGYTLFAITISAICLSIFILYNVQEKNVCTWHHGIFLLAAICVFGKIMSHDKRELWLLLLIFFTFISVGISVIN